MPATNWPSAASFSRLRQPLAQLLALGLEPRLRRQIARDEHAADRLAIVIEQIGDGDHERPLQHRVDDSHASPRRRCAPRRRRSCRSSHAASSGPM